MLENFRGVLLCCVLLTANISAAFAAIVVVPIPSGEVEHYECFQIADEVTYFDIQSHLLKDKFKIRRICHFELCMYWTEKGGFEELEIPLGCESELKFIGEPMA